ncbi:MAG: glutamine-hydrolyzing carbamoyl-phosphate synthase small subunit [Promethearchaeota archaeon]
MATIEGLEERKAVLVLSNGRVFHGKGIGATKKVCGELVFNTAAASGYNCSLTDCSNEEQIIVFTYPLIGNYGVPPWEKDEFGICRWFEGEKVHAKAVVVHESCKEPSHYESVKIFEQFLKEQDIPGIEGVDTRQITKILRNQGTQDGLLQVFPKEGKIPDDETLINEIKKIAEPNQLHLVKEVSTQEVKNFLPKNPIGRVVLIDCGVRLSVIRTLLTKGLEVIQVPHDTKYNEVMDYNPNGVLISNGPGNPEMCTETISTAKKLIEEGIPTMGICLGNLILGLAAGITIFKMKYGHRGSSKTVKDLITGKCYVTPQNHGYAIKLNETIKSAGFKSLFINLEDQTNEGIFHEKKPIFGVQFYPEACAGLFLYNRFLKNMNLTLEGERNNA